MASIHDTLISLFMGAGATPEEAQAKATQYAPHPDAANAVAPLLSANPDMSIKPSSANDSPSSFDVNVSDNTITQNGRPESLPSQIPGTPPVPAAAELPPSAPLAPPASLPSSVPPAASKETSSPTPLPPSSTPVSSLPTSSNDNTARQANLEDALQKRKMGIIPSLLAGAGDTIGTGLKAFGVNTPTDVQEKVLNREKSNFDEQQALFETKLKNDPNSDISKSYRDLVTQIAPGLSKDPNFQNMSAMAIGDKLPLIDTMMKAKASEDAKKMVMAQMQSNKDISLGLRQDQQQDKLEQDAKQMMSNLRADKSLARAEEQRDAAAVAVNRLKEIQSSGKGLNPVDYTDILGQIYRARTGAAPGEQVLQQIRQSTAKGDLGKAYTFITGQQAPATTQDITNSLMNMAQSMGKQADAFHQGYMNSHLIKPSGLEDERWQPILKTERGLSFAKATNQAASPTAAPIGGQRRTSAGHSYTVSQ